MGCRGSAFGVPSMRADQIPWARAVFGILLVALLPCASCRSKPPSTCPSAGALPIAAATLSTEPAPPNSTDRLSALHPSLKSRWLTYLAKEGDAHRSDAFDQVASELDHTCFSESSGTRTHPADRATETEVLSFLGLHPIADAAMEKKPCMCIPIGALDTKAGGWPWSQIRDGLLDQIGWNGASVNDFSSWKQYRKWSDVPGIVR